MNNKRILWLAALLLTAGSAADSYAQSGIQYPYASSTGSSSGKTSVIVSRDAAGGVKSDCIHANWKASTMPDHYENDAANNRVAARFEVASADLSGTMVWPDAQSGCVGYTQAGTSAGDWRLPTQRELMLIYVIYKKGWLTGLSFIDSNYWTTTGYSVRIENFWCMGMGNGQVTTLNYSTKKARVRCIRDF